MQNDLSNECKYPDNFCIDATFEMRTKEYVEICISINDQTNAERLLCKTERWEREQGSRETERDRVCVCKC
jgi:hypothetical protein